MCVPEDFAPSMMTNDQVGWDAWHDAAGGVRLLCEGRRWANGPGSGRFRDSPC